MEHTGEEPALSGAQFGVESSGAEPMLGGERGLSLLRAHVLTELDKPQTTHQRRLAIGQWLARFGDPREGTGLTDDGLPDIAWEAVGGGTARIRDRSGHDETFEVARFWIGRYPVTWAQYAAFLDEAHADPQWWAGLHRRDEYPREAPAISNHPAQEVSWYDAVAYCRWLSAQLGFEVRLPTEWEWQQAANDSTVGNLFPWGQHWNGYRANTRESRLRQATAVGMYPRGVSVYGVFDMCGTVQEWCQNLYANPVETGLGSTRERVTRGGSWFTVKDYAHTFFRTGYDPYQRFNSVGFRLASDEPHLPS